MLDQGSWNHLTSQQKDQLFNTLTKHHEAFILIKNELGLIKAPPAKIHIQDSTPLRDPMYRFPEQAKGIIAEMLEDMQEKDIIEPSSAAWLSPIVLVSKPDGSKRMCLDY